MKRWILIGIAGGAVLAPEAARAQAVAVVENQVIAPLAGRMYRPAEVAPVNFHGTDLGFTFKHRGRLEIFFGDTWQNEDGIFMGPSTGILRDDAAGYICLEEIGGCQNEFPFTTGNHVYLWAAFHPPDPNQGDLNLPWDRGGPPIHFHMDPMTRMAKGLELVSPDLSLGPGETPVAAFSNYPTAAPFTALTTPAAFGIFIRSDYVTCTRDSDCKEFNAPGACDTALSIKSVLGGGGRPGIMVPCVVGADGFCERSTPGLCRDTGSSVAGGLPALERQLLPVIRRMSVGGSPGANPYTFTHKTWLTNRFVNPTVRTIEGFNPTTGQISDPTPANGLEPTGEEKVLIWGRPAFVGNKNAGRSSKLYFGYADMPKFTNGTFEWVVKYFTGFNANVPQFNSNPRLAKPLALDGNPNGSTVENFDIVGQMSVVWVQPLEKWVMLYGGDAFYDSDPFLNHLWIPLPLGIDIISLPFLAYNSTGSIMYRTADKPWGPWSPPQNLFPSNLFEWAAAYRENGIMRSPPPSETGNHTLSCDPTRVIDGTANHCVPHEPEDGLTRYGNLYGPNIVEPWIVDQTEAMDRPAADIFWNVSTWDPYQVVLMRSRLVK